MYTLLKQPLQKHYLSNSFTRSWLLSTSCCLFAFIIPILVLVSIGYSWNTYSYNQISPTFSFQNYQLTCYKNSGSILYDSSFTDQIISNSQIGYLSVGIDNSQLYVSGLFADTLINSCSMLLYLKVSMNGHSTILTTLPLSFEKITTSSLQLSSIQQWGRVDTTFLSAVSQSFIPSNEGLVYYLNQTQSLSMIDIHQQYNQHKNITLSVQILNKKVTYASSPTSLSYTGRFLISRDNFVIQTSLLTNIRSFIPFFIYIFVLLWVFVRQPIIAWMLNNKIYKAKVWHTKLKSL